MPSLSLISVRAPRFDTRHHLQCHNVCGPGSMIHNTQPFIPPTLHLVNSPIRPKSPIMSLNTEPVDAVARQGVDLIPQSYAEAADPESETDIERDIEVAVDEQAIKETPPRVRHTRQSSEPRPLGEVIDESEARVGSPSLRHPKGRIEERNSRESWADVVKERSPAKDNAVVSGNGVPPTSLILPANGVASERSGNKTPETLEGTGEAESPRSPTRRAHKRVSSRSLNGSLPKELEASKPDSSSAGLRLVESTNEGGAQHGQLVYENFRNKSGENLASIKPDLNFYLGMQQCEDKLTSDTFISVPESQWSSETVQPPRKLKVRHNSELVSGRQAGAGWAKSAIRWAPLNVPFQRRLQTFVILLHTLSIVLSLSIFFLMCGIPILWPLLLPYLIYVLLSRVHTDGKLTQRSEWLRRSKIWSLFAGYFPARLHRSQFLEPTRKYVFGYHPHGIISHGAFAAFATEALGFSQLFPGITNTLLTLDSNFRIPLYRDYALRMGLASVSRESCENLLSCGGPNNEGMGRAITIVIGGARESLDARPRLLRLILKRRKGFVKLAIRTGADLVPVLAFGENDLYDQVDAKKHPYIHKGQLLVKKVLGFTVPLFHARGKCLKFDAAISSRSWFANLNNAFRGLQLRRRALTLQTADKRGCW